MSRVRLVLHPHHISSRLVARCSLRILRNAPPTVSRSGRLSGPFRDSSALVHHRAHGTFGRELIPSRETRRMIRDRREMHRRRPRACDSQRTHRGRVPGDASKVEGGDSRFRNYETRSTSRDEPRIYARGRRELMAVDHESRSAREDARAFVACACCRARGEVIGANRSKSELCLHFDRQLARYPGYF